MESRTISNGRRDVRKCPSSLRSKRVRTLTLLVLTLTRSPGSRVRSPALKLSSFLRRMSGWMCGRKFMRRSFFCQSVCLRSHASVHDRHKHGRARAFAHDAYSAISGPLSAQQPPSRPAPPLGGCAHSLVIPNVTPHASAVGGLRGKVGRDALGPAARQRPSRHKHEGDQRDEKQEVCDLEAFIVGTT